MASCVPAGWRITEVALTLQQSRRYVPDLISLQRTCEVNYSRVLIDGVLPCR